ncbi:MAG TPA: PspC domain-containing protein [Patescibacteria group bacterium]|nr:PspC domain-containing protein [Patescibacteria group bacterium]
MNEITKIHLGRQAFTIANDAHKELKTYLEAIKKQVKDAEVVDEIELRMAELLLERDINDNKVVLSKDVEFLKSQLGTPEDFGDEIEDIEETKEKESSSKRLFRDKDNGLVAGVAAGLAQYFGLDVVLVRIAFVLLAIFGGGSGIILYLILWLVVPPAISTSEKLQMQGKPVTLEALKASVKQADVANTARRLNSTLLSAIDRIFKAIIKLAGVGFILTGLAMIMGVAVTRAYIFLHNGRLFQENIFPIGIREKWLLSLIMGIVVTVATFLILAGVAIFKRKWPVRGWITGTLVGLFLLCSVAAGALAADVAPHIQQRYQESLHTTAIKNIQPFTKVATSGQIDIEYVQSPDYAVNVHYVDHPDLSKLKISVSNNTLYIDSQALDDVNHCDMLCLFPHYNMTVQIYAPNVEDFKTPRNTDIFYPDIPPLPSKQ